MLAALALVSNSDSDDQVGGGPIVVPYPTEVALALALAPLRDPTASKLDIRGLEFGAEGPTSLQ